MNACAKDAGILGVRYNNRVIGLEDLREEYYVSKRVMCM